MPEFLAPAVIGTVDIAEVRRPPAKIMEFPLVYEPKYKFGETAKEATKEWPNILVDEPSSTCPNCHEVVRGWELYRSARGSLPHKCGAFIRAKVVLHTIFGDLVAGEYPYAW